MSHWPGLLALPLAAVAFYLALQRPGQPIAAASPPAACACDIAGLEATVRTLRAEVAALQARPTSPAALAGAAPPMEPLRPTPVERPTPRALRRFTSPVPGLAVEQAANGSITVTNRDPALTGQVFTIEAETADGEPTTITVTAPPPE